MMSAGWLRKNGVPYSENATMTEYYDRFAAPNGDEWFAVTTIVSDPKYLNQDFVTSTHFKKEPDGSKWAPKPCKSNQTKPRAESPHSLRLSRQRPEAARRCAVFCRGLER